MLDLMGMRARRVADYLSGHISGGSLLDLGCGDGSVALRVGRLLRARVRGADVVMQKNVCIPAVRYDGRSLPFADRSFDAVMLIWVLHHADDPVAVLREAARVSRGGILVMEVFYRTRFQKRILKALDFMENRPSRIPVPFGFRTIEGWEDAFREAGLGIEYHETGFRVHRADPTMNVLFSLTCGEGQGSRTSAGQPS